MPGKKSDLMSEIELQIIDVLFLPFFFTPKEYQRD
jgi:hypothetical protein